MFFGIQFEVYEEGYEWMNYLIVVFDVYEFSYYLCIKVGSFDCKQFYEVFFFNVFVMSFGSLSSVVIEVLNGGVKIGNFVYNMGEGGVSFYYEIFEGDFVWQIGMGYFGCCVDDGGFDFDKFVECLQMFNIKMIELKLL